MSGVLLVRDVMTRGVKTVRFDTYVKEAVQKMNKFDIGSLVVMQGRRPVGILTERDILKRIVEPCLEPTIVTVKDIMSRPVVTIKPDISIEEAARIMTQKQIKKLPVVENERLVGIITSMDLMRAAPKLITLLEDLLRIKK